MALSKQVLGSKVIPYSQPVTQAPVFYSVIGVQYIPFSGKMQAFSPRHFSGKAESIIEGEIPRGKNIRQETAYHGLYFR